MDEETKEKFGKSIQKWFGNPEFEKEYDKDLKEFALSEFILALIKDDEDSVRKLAKVAEVNLSSIQDLRSGKSKDVKLKNFVNIVKACGFGIELVKGRKRIPIHLS